MKLRDLVSDRGLQLGILCSLMMNQRIDTEVLGIVLEKAVAKLRADAAFWNAEGTPVLDGDNDYRMLGIAADLLGEVEVTEDDLATIRDLSFDGGGDIYMWLEQSLAVAIGLEDYELDTGGESDVYVVRSLEGLGRLPNLGRLSLDAYGFSDSTRSLLPLASAPALEEVYIQGDFSEAESLLRCPALRCVRYGAYPGVPIPDAIVEQLRQKSVEVTTDPMRWD